MTYRDEDAKESASSGRPQKKAKVNGPISMALVAQELSTAVEGITALSARFAEAPQVRTRSDKLSVDQLTQKAKENAKANTQFSTPKKSSFKNGGNDWK
eukprot:2961520-Rhodomonas_salina.1